MNEQERREEIERRRAARQAAFRRALPKAGKSVDPRDWKRTQAADRDEQSREAMRDASRELSETTAALEKPWDQYDGEIVDIDPKR